MNINPHAPLAARKDIFITAPPDKVWATLTQIDRWPEWQPDVSAAKLEGSLAVGTVFRWKAKGMNISSIVRACEPGGLIGWTGDSLGMQAIHIWTLAPQEQGTRVTVEESLSGWLVRILKLFDPAFLEKSMSASLQVLKTRVEGT